ncbi:MAG TPA: hypothetical protein VJ144_02815 [Candidatus Polarisedimenticolia bacterium]|nr:hypothetical protein [Candidatus Polarisedimenticolia bacterium]
MAEARVVNPLVEQFRQGRVPRDLRLMAAQGALPLGPIDLADLLEFLLHDVDQEIRDSASASLAALPADVMLALARDRSSLPGLLSWILTHREEREVQEAVLQNTTLPDEAIEARASTLPEELAELVVINQVRLLRRTSLLEALEQNQGLSKDQRRRLRELRESFHIGEQPPEAAAAPAAATPAPPPAEEPEEEEPPPPANDAEAVARYLGAEERQDNEKVSAVTRLYRQNTAQKMISALKGTREDRAILVRDPNRLVSSAVLGSPKLTDVEIESFAGMKSLSDEVLRRIGNHKEWTKRYGVISNLVKNPRTPLGISIGLVSRLNPRDIKGLAVDRNVPEVIRKQAQKFLKGGSEDKKK